MLRVYGTVGRTYLLETSTDLAHWDPVVVHTPASEYFEVIGSLDATARFYRTCLMPSP